MSALRAESVGVRRDGRRLLDNVRIAIAPGEIHGIIGPNGAGKSTLLRALAGTIAVTDGAVRADEEDLAWMSARRRARFRALLPQDTGSGDDLTVRDLVQMGRYAHRAPWGAAHPEDHRATEAALERTGIAELASRPVATLSGGQRRLAFLAKALAQDPRVLLLDEPLAGLDPRHQLDALAVVRALADDGVGVGLVLHDLELASRVCTRLTLVADGCVVATGAPAEVLAPELIADVYGVRADVSPDPATGGLRIAMIASLPSAPRPSAAIPTPSRSS
ncbi:ABC transporter ATP-binding protein [Microbacterium sp. JZ70]